MNGTVAQSGTFADSANVAKGMGVVYDYFQTNRSTSYKEKWDEWIGQDWAGSYIGKLEPFGLKAPRWFPEAQERMKWVGHSAAMLAALT